MDWAGRYVREMRYRPGGRTLPYVDCWGAHRIVVADRAGVLLPEYPGEASGGIGLRARHPEMDWTRVAPGAERELDLVLMGDNLHPLVPAHCGTVVAPGWMLHVDRVVNALLKPLTHPTLRGRILGIYRSRELA